ncbi:MAG: NAD(+) diphosphatase [Pseudomonadota bacterium]
MGRQRPLFFAGSPLDRADHLRADSDWLERAARDPHSHLVLTLGDDVLATDDNEHILLSRADLDDVPISAFLGLWSGEPVFAAAVDHAPAVRPKALDIRTIGRTLDRDIAAVAAHARALAVWRRRTAFCPICGGTLEHASAGHSAKCTSCGVDQFPRVDPAVIMLVHDGGDRVLLGRSAHFPPGMHSVLAGFVEPGESLEEAVEREVYEEVGVRVRDVQYRGSQPWPFPQSLMLGFIAEARETTLSINTAELEAADWYTRDALLAPAEARPVALPRAVSISRELLNDWLYNG